ncbi:hypothetical protein K1719_014256 [Acacia pycnantha]|nr:hypothetical protein K1719_014256 [Acacia pycnantha]
MAISVAVILVVILVPFSGVVNGRTKELRECDIYNGRWVYDSSYPLYNSGQCPFIETPFDCQQNGRPDHLYLKYRWKPRSCNLPRFNASKFLEMYKNTKILFVGDSISLNQWQSLACMLHSRTPHSEYTLERVEAISTFTFKKENVSLIFQRNTLLVELDIHDKSYGRLLRLNSIAEDYAKLWRGCDVLVFNSWHWWEHRGRKTPWDYITDDGEHMYKDMDRLVAYEKAMSTWAKWVDEDIDFSKTQVFFQGISPTHDNAENWGNHDGKNCSEETRPVFGPTYPKENPAEKIVEKVIGNMSKRVNLLNILRLSQQRKDGHPSIYGRPGKKLGMDCSHWCLPGVPDAWNELLIAELTRS